MRLDNPTKKILEFFRMKVHISSGDGNFHRAGSNFHRMGGGGNFHRRGGNFHRRSWKGGGTFHRGGGNFNGFFKKSDFSKEKIGKPFLKLDLFMENAEPFHE